MTENASSLQLTSVKPEILINLGRGRLNNDVRRTRARVSLPNGLQNIGF
jgi:hypothetical protein